MTRDGVTGKVNADAHLPNGVIAKPDGTILPRNGQEIIPAQTNCWI